MSGVPQGSVLGPLLFCFRSSSISVPDISGWIDTHTHTHTHTHAHTHTYTHTHLLGFWWGWSPGGVVRWQHSHPQYGSWLDSSCAWSESFAKSHWTHEGWGELPHLCVHMGRGRGKGTIWGLGWQVQIEQAVNHNRLVLQIDVIGH